MMNTGYRTGDDRRKHPQIASSKKIRAILLVGVLALAIGAIVTPVSATAIQDPTPPASPVKLIFIHHSTGEAWLADDYGGLGTALRTNGYFVSDTNYGWGPGAIGDRTDIGHWWDWFRGPSHETILGALYTGSGQHSSYSRLASDPGGENTIIMFKSCFPNSALGGTPGAAVPAIGSNPLKSQSCDSAAHTVANAKGIYTDLLTYFASRPDKLFVVITAPPLSDPSNAANARAFNEWLVHDWLSGYTLNNVAVFDYYTVLTTNNGTVNKNDLGALTGNHHRFRNAVVEHIGNGDNDANPNISEYSSSPGDDHPSKAGDQKATGEFLPLLNIAYNRWREAQNPGSGTLSVMSTPGGASVTVDGTARGTTGETPLVITGLSAGSHSVRCTLAGYLDYGTTATVTAGQTTVLLPRLTPAGPGCPVFPADHIWNVPVDTLPVDPQSSAYITTIGATSGLHPDFGSGTWDGFPIGIPYVTVPGIQPKVPVTFDQYGDQSDPGPYPIPSNPPIEGNPDGSADRHLLIVDRDNNRLYELYAAHQEADGWYAGSGAIFDLAGYDLRQETWTSADAAGLAILPGLVRYEEVAAGEITHAIRFTAPETRTAYVWPARHYASDLAGSRYPPMGQRFRLKADYDISGFSPRVQIILTALKTYGMVLADNGAAWYIGGVPDERWDNDELHILQTVPGSAFEAVNVSSLMISRDSGQARTAVPDTTPPRSVRDLGNTTCATSCITWTWTDPADADFAKVMVFLDGTFRANVTKGTQLFNATGLAAGSPHSIGTRTVDTTGNINATWVNHTAMTPSAGTTYYVAPGGDNANPGTLALPWATPGYGSRQLSPGDTLIIRGGTYSLQVFDQDIIMPPPGETGRWIVIRGEEGSRPVLKGAGNLYSAIILSGSRYLRIENLEITSDTGEPFRGGIVGVEGVLRHVVLHDLFIHHIDEYAVDIRDCEDLIIENCSFLYCGFGAIGGPEAIAGGWQDAVIRSCNLSYSGHYYQGTPGPGPYDRPDGFGIEPSAGPVTITGTVASHNRGDGLDSKAGNTSIDHCIVANNACDGVKLWGDGSRVENTLIYGTGDGTGGASPWAGIVIGADSPPNARFTLINVAVHDNPTRQAYPMYVQYGSSNPISLVMRNMIIANGYGLVYIGDPVALTADHNLFFRPGSDEQVYANGRTYSRADITSGLLGEGNLWGDPLFTSPAWGSEGDYHLLAGSPAIDAGSAAGAPATDLDGVSRPQGAGYDMGPYEYRSDIPPPDTTPPRGVTNLKNATYAGTYIRWTWTDPADADFAKVMVFLNGTFRANVTKGAQSYNATGLTASTLYTISTRTVDTHGNVNQTWVNHTAKTAPGPSDTTPPRGVTNLKNATYAGTYIRWTWTDPVDGDFAKVMVFLDGTFRTNVTKGTQYYNATGLTANTLYTISTRTVDTTGNINQTWVNHTARTKPAGDTTPPKSVTRLKNATYAGTYIRWTWTDPVNADFSRVMVYLNGVYQKDVTKGTKSYNATGLTASTLYTVSTRTVDTSGNINQTWVNHTARTKPAGETTPPKSVTGLKNTTYAVSYVRWTWTDPTDADFSRVMVYLNGVYQKDVRKGTRYYLATGLTPNTRYTISTRTVDTSGNINPAWVNNTARTKARLW